MQSYLFFPDSYVIIAHVSRCRHLCTSACVDIVENSFLSVLICIL